MQTSFRSCSLALALALCACGSDPNPQGAAPTEPAKDASVDASVDAGPRLKFPQIPPVPELSEWPSDPTTELKAELGRVIFYDARLSASGRSSCNNCHVSLTSFQDNLPLSVPDRSYPKDSPKTERHASSLLNLVYANVFRWDGSSEDLFDVLAFPFSEANMNLGADVPSAKQKLKEKLTQELTGYPPRFLEAFGADLNALTEDEVWQLTGRALAHFMRRVVSKDSAFDRFNAGDETAIDDDAKKGAELFVGKARCVTCHDGPLLSDFAFHNISSELPDESGKRHDEGRAHVTGKPEDAGKFLTPSLRGSYDTAPYFHDGSMPGLRAVIEHFASEAAAVDPGHDTLVKTPPSLSSDEVKQLIAFMRSLRGAPLDPAKIGPPSAFP